MRISGSNAATQVSGQAAARRVSASGFSIGDQGGLRATAGATSLRTVGGIDALLALQGQDDLPERRRRAVKRGGVALDALDELKLGLLSGSLGPSTLSRLASATADLADASGDPGLDAVLCAIDLRLQVEIAKLTPARQS